MLSTQHNSIDQAHGRHPSLDSILAGRGPFGQERRQEMNAEETKTVEVTVVVDPRHDMWAIGNGEEWDTPFFAAYREAAERLERAANRVLVEDGAEVRVVIDVVRGRYTGPAMQHDCQPDWDDEVPLWQRLHNMVWPEEGPKPRFRISEPEPDVVERLAEWAVEQE